MKQEDIKRLWEWCEVEFFESDGELIGKTPTGGTFTLILTLDNLFKYAVPKLCHYELNNWCGKHTAWAGIERNHYKSARGKEPAEALAQAILKVIENETQAT